MTYYQGIWLIDYVVSIHETTQSMEQLIEKFKLNYRCKIWCITQGYGLIWLGGCISTYNWCNSSNRNGYLLFIEAYNGDHNLVIVD